MRSSAAILFHAVAVMIVALVSGATRMSSMWGASRKNWRVSAKTGGLGAASTAPVGSFQANALGLYDMLGNVGEFCSDGYQGDYYWQSPAEDPSGPREKAKGHVVRGGTFLNGPGLVGATSRVECPDVYRNYAIGFRVVLETGGK